MKYLSNRFGLSDLFLSYEQLSKRKQPGTAISLPPKATASSQSASMGSKVAPLSGLQDVKKAVHSEAVSSGHDTSKSNVANAKTLHLKVNGRVEENKEKKSSSVPEVVHSNRPKRLQKGKGIEET